MIAKHYSPFQLNWMLCLSILLSACTPKPLDTGQGHAELQVGHIKVAANTFTATTSMQDKIAVCAACHGDNGLGDADFGPDADFGTPRLAGLSAIYLQNQLQAWQQGQRQHAEMTPLAAILPEADVVALSQHYSQLPGVNLKPEALQLQLISRSADLQQAYAITLGQVTGIQSCNGCHALQTLPTNSAFPQLAGQNARYLEKRLNDYAQNRVSTPMAAIMTPIAKRLSASQITALSHYYAGIGQ